MNFCAHPHGPRAAAAAASIVAIAIVALLAGCGRSPSDGPSANLPEISGAPIQMGAKKSGTVTVDPSSSIPSTNREPASANSARPAPLNPTDSAAASPADTTAPAPPSVSAAAPSNRPGQAVNLGFDLLAGYTFEVSDDLLGPVTNDVAAVTEKTNAKIPDTVKSYDYKKVALKGFMLPLKVEGGLVTEMLIMKDQSMCCYGATPRINDWVSVKMKKKGVRPAMDMPVTLFGTMRIGEMRENGYLVGIYSMDGDTMEAPELD